MPRLGEVLGSVVTDVLRAQLAADALTAQALDSYRQDPVLSALSVPRVSLSDLTVRLRFLVAGMTEAEPRPVDAPRALTTWNSGLRTRVLPGLLTGRERDEKLRAAVRMLQQGLVDRPIVLSSGVLEECLQGNLGPILDLTFSELMNRGKGTPVAELREPLLQAVRQEAAAFSEVLRQRQIADQALRSRVDVEVGAAQLSAASPESVQTLEVTVSLADVEAIVTAATGGQG